MHYITVSARHQNTFCINMKTSWNFHVVLKIGTLALIRTLLWAVARNVTIALTSVALNITASRIALISWSSTFSCEVTTLSTVVASGIWRVLNSDENEFLKKECVSLKMLTAIAPKTATAATTAASSTEATTTTTTTTATATATATFRSFRAVAGEMSLFTTIKATSVSHYLLRLRTPD